MARARIIKPGFFKNEDLIECSFAARLLFAGLWTLADKAGRLEDRPKKIKIEIFPGDNVDCDELLNELSAHHFIKRYQVDGKKYIEITSFCAHQKPHRNEVESTIPQEKAQPKSEQDAPKSEQSGLNLNPDYLNLNPVPPIPPKGDFSDWYELYPHKIGKGAAEKAYAKAIKQADRTELIDGLRRYIDTKPPDRPWCNPSTWLNQQRWKDKPNEIPQSNHRKSKSERADDVLAEFLAEQGITGENHADSPHSPPELQHLADLRQRPGGPERPDEGIQRRLVGVSH